MLSPRKAFQEMVDQWPETGWSFEELRGMMPGRYDELRDLVFEAIEEGLVRQRFDVERRAMILVRRTL